MDTDHAAVVDLLTEHGFKLVRRKKHCVYKNDKGRIWVVPATPTDSHSYANNLASFKKLILRGQEALAVKVQDSDRTAAEQVLHPPKPRREKIFKERRIVQKTIHQVATMLPQAIQRAPRNQDQSIDIYKFGRQVEQALNKLFMDIAEIEIKKISEWHYGRVAERLEKMKQDGVPYEEAKAFFFQQRQHAKAMAERARYRVHLLARALTRVFQKSLRCKHQMQEFETAVNVTISRALKRNVPHPFNAPFVKASWTLLEGAIKGDSLDKKAC